MGGHLMEKVIITIARQHGSGGRLIGQKLAEMLDIPFYDKELIFLTAKKTGFAEEFVREVEEKHNVSLLYGIYNASGAQNVYDQAQTAQFNVIRELAEKGSCVIVGRAADCILKDNPNCVRVFIHAHLEDRIRRATEDYKEDMGGNAEKTIQKRDKARATFYNVYSTFSWGDTRNYHLTLDSSIGIDKAAEVIKAYVEAKQGK